MQDNPWRIITRPRAMERCHGWNGSSHIFEVHGSWLSICLRARWFWGMNDGYLSIFVLHFLPQNWELTFGASRILENEWHEYENDWVEAKWDDVSHPFMKAFFANSSCLSLAIQAQSAGLLSAFRDQVRKTWQRVGWMEDNGGQRMSSQGYLSQTPINIATVSTLTST